MKAKLIAYTQPVENETIGLDDVQDLIAYCAKVSNPKGQADLSTSESLLNYLIKNQHWSPFEMATATVEIETTRDIARQMLRHRSFAFQEFSQRYADPRDMENTFVLREARLQDTKNRQNSVDVDNPKLSAEWRMRQQDIIDAAKAHYNWAIGNGIAKEQARVVLPEGLTVSKLYAQGSIRSWIHYVALRSANGTQREHMDLAVEIGKAISKIFPMIGEQND
jgi:thymidylate synthase (FAD)|tara:strand:+ start:111 stop:776 length:666 start_codon:yes stop_codon:yes gene_type:complete